METRYEDEFPNTNVINHVPISFGSADEMLHYLRNDGDLYNPKEKMYVFDYSARGAIAMYYIDKEEAAELSRKVRDSEEEYWGAFLGPGGRIFDTPDGQCDDDYALEFCEDYYAQEWYDTEDYAALALEQETNNENQNGNQREITEVCPHCDAEVNINWDVETQGYVARCPECGRCMMLCDECLHAEDNECQRCDWHTETGSTFRDDMSVCFRGRYPIIQQGDH